MKNILGFLDNCILIACTKLSLLLQEYLSSAVNVLINNPRVLDVSKRDVFQLNVFQNDE